MKNLGKIKLNQFRKAELEKRAMHSLIGGSGGSCVCVCVGGECAYASTPIATHRNTCS
jgi:natural product precursor